MNKKNWKWERIELWFTKVEIRPAISKVIIRFSWLIFLSFERKWFFIGLVFGAFGSTGSGGIGGLHQCVIKLPSIFFVQWSEFGSIVSKVIVWVMPSFGAELFWRMTRSCSECVGNLCVVGIHFICFFFVLEVWQLI